MISTRTQTRRGFSLIEVAIALVIFVIGALAIIRIFPGALSVINNNGDQLVATNLSRSKVVALQSDKAVPDASFNNRGATGVVFLDDFWQCQSLGRLEGQRHFGAWNSTF